MAKKKLSGAALKAHNKKMASNGGKSKKSASKPGAGAVLHKAYSYTNKQGKTITVAAHYEHPTKRKK